MHRVSPRKNPARAASVVAPLNQFPLENSAISLPRVCGCRGKLFGTVIKYRWGRFDRGYRDSFTKTKAWEERRSIYAGGWGLKFANANASADFFFFFSFSWPHSLLDIGPRDRHRPLLLTRRIRAWHFPFSTLCARPLAE